MRRYSTQIVIPNDRLVVIQVPESVPEGAALLTILAPETEPDGNGAEESEDDLRDIEWWEEFEDAAS